MGIIRVVSIGRHSDNHASTPRVAAQKPIKSCLLQLSIGCIPCELPVPITLYRKCSLKVIATPNEWDSAVESILLTSFPNHFYSIAVKLYCLLFDISFCVLC